MKTLRSIPASFKKSAARRNCSSVMRLLSRSRTSGWTVSRPIATSSRPESRSRNVEAARSHQGRVALHDGPSEGRRQPRDRRVFPGRDRTRVEETARVVELEMRPLPGVIGGRRSRAYSIWAAMAPSGTVSSSVFRQRSHITHRQGHSRLVRKIVATSTAWPSGPGSVSATKAYGRHGSRTFRAGRRSSIQRLRAAGDRGIACDVSVGPCPIVHAGTALPETRSAAGSHAVRSRSSHWRRKTCRHQALLTFH